MVNNAMNGFGGLGSPLQVIAIGRNDIASSNRPGAALLALIANQDASSDFEQPASQRSATKTRPTEMDFNMLANFSAFEDQPTGMSI